jgi:tellurite resistance protein
MFGMVLGIGGLGAGWRAASHVWAAPTMIGETLALTASAIWLVWFSVYVLKWIQTPKPPWLRSHILSSPSLSYSFR